MKPGCISNETNLLVGQTSDLLTQDATHVSVRNEQTSRSEGYEPKAKSSQAIPEITSGIVSRSIKRKSTALKGRSNSSPGSPTQTSRCLVVRSSKLHQHYTRDIKITSRMSRKERSSSAWYKTLKPQGISNKRLSCKQKNARPSSQDVNKRWHFSVFSFLRFQLETKAESEQFTKLPPPKAVPAMAATVGPPITYAPPNTPNPFVGTGYQENPYRTLTELPPVRQLLHHRE
eukprot:4841547-Amphidinium_carterae.3